MRDSAPTPSRSVTDFKERSYVPIDGHALFPNRGEDKRLARSRTPVSELPLVTRQDRTCGGRCDSSATQQRLVSAEEGALVGYTTALVDVTLVLVTIEPGFVPALVHVSRKRRPFDNSHRCKIYRN